MQLEKTDTIKVGRSLYQTAQKILAAYGVYEYAVLPGEHSVKAGRCDDGSIYLSWLKAGYFYLFPDGSVLANARAALPEDLELLTGALEQLAARLNNGADKLPQVADRLNNLNATLA